jgi:N4-gp56 family major capsid protein
MGNTTINYGDPNTGKIVGAGLYLAAQQRRTIIGKLGAAQKLSQSGDVEKELRFQSTSDMPIVTVRDLTRFAGDEVSVDLLHNPGGLPVMGDETAEGYGEELTMSVGKVRIDMTRKPISAGGAMTQQRTPHDMKRIARAAAFNYMTRLDDQRALVHLAGARGFHVDDDWVVPLASHEKFSSIMVNAVKSPTKVRHFISTGSGIESVKAGSNEITIASTDIMNISVLDALSSMLDSMAGAPKPVIVPGDEAAYDSPIRILLVSAEQYNSIQTANSSLFRTFQSNAVSRSAQAKHPLFRGEVLLWNGLLVMKMPKPIRFYSGNPLAWCASATTETETTTDLVPSSFSTSYAVDRSLLIGGQALFQALGSYRDSGGMDTKIPYFYNEELLDHRSRFEALCGKIGGEAKARFRMRDGIYLDHGVIAIDTAVPLVG